MGVIPPPVHAAVSIPDGDKAAISSVNMGIVVQVMADRPVAAVPIEVVGSNLDWPVLPTGADPGVRLVAEVERVLLPVRSGPIARAADNKSMLVTSGTA